jgi:hypothetical protein
MFLFYRRSAPTELLVKKAPGVSRGFLVPIQYAPILTAVSCATTKIENER